AGLLRDEGFASAEAGSVKEALAAVAAAQGAAQTGAAGEVGAARDRLVAIVLDVGLPDASGLTFLERLPKPFMAPVIVLSGGATASEAVRALRLGATDFVEKPPTAERLLTAVNNAIALHRLEEERARLLVERERLVQERERLVEDLSRPGKLLGESAAMQELRTLIARVGQSESSVLIQGETGAGKERVARALHDASGRKGRFVAINCAALPAALLESELFGHERGAFTGANARRLGRFEQAEGGTLLLDGFGELELSLLARLLRVLVCREVERLGGARPVRVDVRVLAATHRDLKALVAEGKFRQDLFYRLAVFPLAVPPLRARASDLLPLVQAFVAELGGASLELRVLPEGERALRAWSWPGNVRELRNLVERLLLLRESNGAVVLDGRVTQLLSGAAEAQAPRPQLGQASLRDLLEDHERALLREALAQSQGNVAAAARLLQVDRGNLYRRLKALDVLPAGEAEE
ncbi:MAG: sigma-54-dependent Fis family transcriptional regulator, partial [Deltaproteobacteria bacterium]|nr:sigma-54-dependent Fis family transcriptional regulator [Deltaproteobacteria bacterium]